MTPDKGYFPNRPESYKEDITSTLVQLGNAVPEPVELGYHLCYGTPNDKHVVMPTDLANTVEITHLSSTGSAAGAPDTGPRGTRASPSASSFSPPAPHCLPRLTDCG